MHRMQQRSAVISDIESNAVNDVLDKICSPADAPEVYRRLSDRADGVITICFDWQR